jgi:hypothetical protein
LDEKLGATNAPCARRIVDELIAGSDSEMKTEKGKGPEEERHREAKIEKHAHFPLFLRSCLCHL